jgi:hypothetical protein
METKPMSTTSIDRKFFDISNKVRWEELSTSGTRHLSPFILARQYGSPTNDGGLSWKNVPFWLEYKASGLPNECDFARQPEINENQKLSSYDYLPPLRIGQDIETMQAVAERIPDGDVGCIPVGSGYLWTMIPKDSMGEIGPLIKVE